MWYYGEKDEFGRKIISAEKFEQLIKKGKHIRRDYPAFDTGYHYFSNCVIKGSLKLHFWSHECCGVKNLVLENVVFDENIDFALCELRRFLGNNVEVRGDANFWHSPIQNLPDNFRVLGNLSLHNCKVSSVPRKLYVKKDCFFTESSISKIPSDLVVGKILELTGTSVKYIPKWTRIKFVHKNGILCSTPASFNLAMNNVPAKVVKPPVKKKRKKKGDEKVDCVFSAQKYETLTKLLEIPEMWDKVYYTKKSMFLELLKRL